MPYSTASPRRSVHRTRLLAALGDWRTHRLVRVVAPAGFGKSILGAQWFQQLAGLPADERPTCAWIALEATDNAPERLLARLTDALHFDFPESPEIISRWLTAELPPARILADLLKLLAAHPAPVVLLFDDVHRLRDAAPLALLQSILDDGPPNVRLALFSRTRPPLQTSRLSLDQSILTLSAHELSFDHDEFAAFVADSPLASLEADRLTSLERRAGGWPAGLQMLRQASRHSELLTIEISDRLVAEDFWEYIEHEVLYSLPAKEIDFLLVVSMLPFLTVALCAAVTGLPAAECEALLTRISAVNGLVTAPVGNDPARPGRIHAVLQDFLLRRLMQHRTSADLQAMRRRAALHLAAADDVDAALDMLLPTSSPSSTTDEPNLHDFGNDIDAAAMIIEQACHTAVQRGDLLAMRRWIRTLPEAELSTRPRLAVDNGWASIHLMETGSEQLLQTIYDAMRAAPDQVDETLCAEVAALEAMRRMIDGRHAESWDALQRARTMPITPDSVTEGYLLLCSGYLMHSSRTLHERTADLRRAGDIFTRAGNRRGRIESLQCEVSLHRVYADSAGLAACAARALQVIRELRLEASAHHFLLHREVADTYYAMHQLEAARAEYAILADLVGEHRSVSWAAYTVDLRLQLYDIAEGKPLVIDDDDDDAQWNLLRRDSAPLIVNNAALRRIHRDMLRGRPDLCWRTVTSLGIQPSDLTDAMHPSCILAVLTGAVFAGRHLDSLAPLLTEFRDRTRAVGHHFFKLHAHALLVQLHLMRRHTKPALAELRHLLVDLEANGFIGVVLQLPAIHPLFPRIDTPFAAHLAGLTNSAPVKAVTITPAEQRVLDALAADGTTVQIAEQLVISHETVRSHIKSIYAKLDVRKRTEALEKARDMGIL